MCDINENTNLYDNYTNYIYKVTPLEDLIHLTENKYILFNPSLHFWITIDDIGLAIYNEIVGNSNVNTIKNKLIQKFSIDDNIFYDDVIPFIKDLINKKFLTIENAQNKEADWMKKYYDINNIKRYPFSDIYISLTDKCNLNCVYCFNKERRKDRSTQEKDKGISTIDILQVLGEFKELGGKNVILTGGEPTLSLQLLNICKESKKIGLAPHFITNGTLLNKFNLDELFESVDSFGLSLDSIEQNEIERLWDSKNISIKSILDTLKKIDKYSKEIKRINIVLMPIVSKINIKSLGKLVNDINEILSNCDIGWMMTRYSPISNENVDKLLEISESEYMKAVARSLKYTYLDKNNKLNKNSDSNLKKLNNKITSFSISNNGKLLPSAQPKLLTCAPSFFVLSNGDVYPCQGFEREGYKLGNILEDNLKSMFESRMFQNVRESVMVNNKEDCSLCELRFVCSNKCSACSVTCDKNKDECKQIAIQRLFIQTQFG